MEQILHFPGQRRLSNKTRTVMVESLRSESEKREKDEGAESPLIKKSHFGEKTTKEMNLFECECIEDDEYHTPLKLSDNFKKGASKEKNFSKIVKKDNELMSNNQNLDVSPTRKNSRSKTDTASEFKFMKTEKNDNLLNNENPLDKRIDQINLFDSNPIQENLKYENMDSFAIKKRVNLKVMVTPPLKSIHNEEELNSSDKINLMKKRNLIENIVNNNPFRHLIFAPFVTESTLKRHLTITYRGLVYAKKCLKEPSESYIRTKYVNLVESKTPRYKTLLLDLDETLIHTCSLKENPENIIKMKGDFGEELIVGLNIRPYCVEFLEKLSKHYEIFIFTASSPNYANAIVNFLDPNNQYINGILSRSNCMETKNGFFIKDLRIIKNRDLKNIIIVDNLSHSFGFQIENGIPILEYHSDRKDRELKYLTDYLLEELYVDDIREFNKRKLRLLELVSMSPEELSLS